MEARTERAGENFGQGFDLAGPLQQLDLLGTAAETSNAERRARGRPEGAANKRNAETFDYLEALGFKAPERLLMEVVSADVVQLARKLGADPVEVLKLQIKAAADLMPYKLARKPMAVEVNRKSLHVFMSGTLTDEQKSQIEQNQWVTLDDVVRQPDNPSHDEAIVESDQGLDATAAADHKTADQG